MDIEPLENGSIDPHELKFDPDNPNEMTAQQFEGLKQSIITYGILENVVIDQDNIICDGQHRTMAALELGILVPYSRIKLSTPIDRRIIRQILNKLKGKHDPFKDAQEFVSILKANQEAKLFKSMAVRETEFYKAIGSIGKTMLDDIIPDVPEDPVTQPGDVWECAGHKIMCGDSTSKADVAKLMGEDRAHIIITDPPYGVDYVASIEGREGTTGKWKHIKGDELKGKALENFCAKFLINIKEFSTKDSAYYIFFGMKTFHHILAAFDSTGVYYALPLIWYKSRPTVSWAKYHPDYEVIAYGGEGAKAAVTTTAKRIKSKVYASGASRNNYKPDYEPIAFAGAGAKPTGNARWFAKYDQTTTWLVKPDANTTYDHPTQKPVELAEKALLNSSREGEICLDLFTGSGFAAIACHKLKRIFRGMELEPSYTDVAVLRLEHYAQTPARLIRNGKEVAVGYKKAESKG